MIIVYVILGILDKMAIKLWLSQEQVINTIMYLANIENILLNRMKYLERNISNNKFDYSLCIIDMYLIRGSHKYITIRHNLLN
jgi:hypothetical protein